MVQGIDVKLDGVWLLSCPETTNLDNLETGVKERSNIAQCQTGAIGLI